MTIVKRLWVSPWTWLAVTAWLAFYATLHPEWWRILAVGVAGVSFGK